MKKGLLVIIALGLCILLAGKVLAQSNIASQTVNLAVNNVARLSVTPGPINLTITDGVAGTSALSSVTDNTTTYSLTQNVSATAKITANISAAVPANTTLHLQLTPSSGKGTSAGSVDISSATADVNVVTSIPLGADNNCMITYTFGADATAGVVTSTNRTVTLTLTN